MIHDTIFFYAKSTIHLESAVHDHYEEYIDSFYRQYDADWTTVYGSDNRTRPDPRANLIMSDKGITTVMAMHCEWTRWRSLMQKVELYYPKTAAYHD